MSTPGWNPHPQQPDPRHHPQAYPPGPPYAPQSSYPPGPPYQQGYPPSPGPGFGPPVQSSQPPLFQMRLTEHTGMVLMWSQRSYTVVGTIEQCEAYFQRAQSHCLGAGWWSIASVLLFNWLALSNNRRAIKSARTQWSALARGYPPQPR